jgi:putative transposase
MKWLFQPLLMLIANSTQSELAAQVEFLKAENAMLRRRLPRRIRLDEVENRAGSCGWGRRWVGQCG